MRLGLKFRIKWRPVLVTLTLVWPKPFARHCDRERSEYHRLAAAPRHETGIMKTETIKAETIASIAGVTAPSIDGELLWGFWYPALRSDEIPGRELATSTRLDVPLVIGRDAAGKTFALRDVCPHRAFPLSAGHSDGQTVECA